jgi:hypothetical protein
MIEVLMYASAPVKISPYLKKCFEAIDDLRFNEGDIKGTILAIVSPDKEELEFGNGIVISNA